MSEEHSVTQLLDRLAQGDESATSQLFSRVFNELRKQARRLMMRERANHTLQPTALVNEVFLRLVARDELRHPENSRLFYFTALRAMRQLLIEHERARSANKRGGDLNRLPDVVLEIVADESLQFSSDDTRTREVPEPLDTFLDQVRGQYGLGFGELSDVIDELAILDEQGAQIVWMRFLAGMTLKGVAGVLGLSEGAADSEWRAAKSQLKLMIDERTSRHDS